MTAPEPITLPPLPEPLKGHAPLHELYHRFTADQMNAHFLAGYEAGRSRALADARQASRSAGEIAAKLNAMAINYSGGHHWDALDAEVCKEAASMLKTLAMPDASQASEVVEAVKMVAVCCGRTECGGECGREWQGEEPARDSTEMQAAVREAGEPLTKEQRHGAFCRAEKVLMVNPNKSWRDAIADEIERAHGILGASVASRAGSEPVGESASEVALDWSPGAPLGDLVSAIIEWYEATGVGATAEAAKLVEQRFSALATPAPPVVPDASKAVVGEASEYDGLPSDAMPLPSDWRYLALSAKVRDLLHLLSFAEIKTPSEGDAPEAVKVMAGLRHLINTEQPSAAPQGADALREVIEQTAQTIERQLELIGERATKDFLDKRPVVQSLRIHVKRLRAALAQHPGAKA